MEDPIASETTLQVLLLSGNFRLEPSFWPTHLRTCVRHVPGLVTNIRERVLLDIPALGHARTV